MNTPKSVLWGWVVFTVAGVGGAYIGYRQWASGKESRRLENVELRERQKQQIEQHQRKLADKRTQKAEAVTSKSNSNIPPAAPSVGSYTSSGDSSQNQT
jgi:hypothetical protein